MGKNAWERKFHVAKLEATQNNKVYSVDMLVPVHISLQSYHSIVALTLAKCGMHHMKLLVLLPLMGKQLTCEHPSIPHVMRLCSLKQYCSKNVVR